MKSSRVAFVAVILVQAALMFGQTQPNLETGYKPYGSHDVTSIDSINTMNGDLQLHIGLPFNYPQRGDRLALPVYLHANSKGWHANSYSYSCGGSCTAFGWGNPPGGIQLITSPTMAINRVWQSDAAYISGAMSYYHGGYYIVTRDGANHVLSGNPATADSMGEPWSFDASDTSGLHLELSGSLGPGGAPSTAIVTDRNGNQYQFGPWGSRCRTNANAGAEGAMPHALGGGWNLSNYGQDTITTCNQRTVAQSIKDSNGNVINFDSLDTLGRSPYSGSSTTDYSGCMGVVSSAMIYSFAAYNGGSAQLKLCSTTPNVATAFNVPNVAEYPTWPGATNNDYQWPTRSWVTTAILPDGSKYTFSYDNYGEITVIGLPTGGSISYTWTTIALNPCNDPTPVSRAVASRSFNDGLGHTQTWSYVYNTLSANSLKTTVTDPNQNDTVHIFSPTDNSGCMLYETSTRFYSGSSSSGPPLKQVDTHYLSVLVPDDTGYPASMVGNVVPDSVKTSVYPSNKMTQVTKSYDPPQSSTGVIFGNVVTEKLYDWGPGGPGSGPGALLRETDTVYQWQKNSSYLTAHIVDLPASSVVIDPVAANNTRSGCPINAVGGTASCIAETDSFYDEPAYLTASGISTQHVAPPAAVRGNLTTLSHWLNTANAFVSGHANWYDTGEPYQNIDPLGHTTTLSYGSAYVGAYVTQTCSPQTGTVTHCISGAYDFNTGLLTSFTDQNGQTSNYGYDLMFRITSAQAPVDVANGSLRATTSLSYSTTSLPWSVTRTRSITGALTDSATSMFDGLGRGYKTQHVTPGGTATVDTTFDLGGHVATVSNPYFTTSDSTYGITTNQYDGLDRATQVTKQDGSISAVDYSLGNCTTSTDEAGNKRRGCSDGLGRLVEVDEPNPSAATTSAQASITINGSEQSNPLPAASGTGSVIISGAEGTSEVCTDPEPPAHPVCHNLPDSGTIGIKVGTYPTLYVNYGSGSTGATLALVLQLGFHNDPSSPVDAAIDPANNTKINFTARTTGVATNYPVTYFNGQDFTFSGLAALSGGRDASSSPDTGTVSITVSGTPYSTTYNGSDTGATIATRLSTAISAGSFANAAASGNVITLTAKSTGQGGDYLFSTASTYDTTHFSGPSFTPSPASSSMANGYGASEIGNQSFITLYQYNALGNLLCVEQHGNVAGTGCSAAPSSDTTSPWRVRRFTYDSLGRLLTTHNPESGTITYSYDLDGNLLQKTSPLANQAGAATQTISYCYDELHRVTGRGYGALSCPMASPVVSYTCDVGANAKGKLTSLIDQAGTATYSYDPLGRITGETRVISGISKSLSYGYNLDGSLKSLTYPSGATVTYAPDSAGRVVSAVDSANGINYATGATYDATGSLTSLVNGNTGTFAGMTSTFTYNKRLQPVNMSAASPSQTVFSIGYDFHVGNGTSGTDNGNVWGITNYKDNARNQSFTYDALNRLTSAQNAGTNCETTIVGGKTEYWGNSYAYDAWGNLTNKTVTKCSAENLSVTALSNNWLSGGYVYDAAGNMTHDATANLNYTFDQENRITGAGGYTYTYDGDGNRVKKSNGTTGTLYWNMTPGIVAESDLAGTLNSEYVFFGGKRVARRDLAAPTGVSYYFSDNLKTASVITDSAGVIKAESDYYPWGGELQFIANDSNHYKFTGKERDFESGLDYFGVRYYSNGLGRWTSPDPKGIALRHLLNPQKLNKYSYVLNSPLTLFDPNGMEEVTMQLNAFISKPNVGGFRGDNRSFSADMHASSRVSVTVKVETDPAKNHGNPLIGKPEIRVGTTHQNAQPFLGMPTSHEATSTGPKMPEVTATQDKSGNVTVNIQESLRNPFTPPGSGSIQANVNMTVNQDATKAEVSGSISGSPSFESNFSVDGGATQNLPLQTEPSSTLGFMWGLQGTSNIDKKTDLPPPPKKKDEQQ